MCIYLYIYTCKWIPEKIVLFADEKGPIFASIIWLIFANSGFLGVGGIKSGGRPVLILYIYTYIV
jgi:hypothetical protein